MSNGICVGAGQPQLIAAAKSAGFDYIETCIKDLIKLDRGGIESFAEQLYKNSIKCETGNCFIKNNLRVVGFTARDDIIQEYDDA